MKVSDDTARKDGSVVRTSVAQGVEVTGERHAGSPVGANRTSGLIGGAASRQAGDGTRAPIPLTLAAILIGLPSGPQRVPVETSVAAFPANTFGGVSSGSTSRRRHTVGFVDERMERALCIISSFFGRPGPGPAGPLGTADGVINDARPGQAHIRALHVIPAATTALRASGSRTSAVARQRVEGGIWRGQWRVPTARRQGTFRSGNCLPRKQSDCENQSRAGITYVFCLSNSSEQSISLIVRQLVG